MNRKERQEARAQRYRELSLKANQQSADAFNQSNKMIECIPAGQPILVGHHSERAHRSLLDRSWNTLGKSVKLGEKAEYFEDKEYTINSVRVVENAKENRLQLFFDGIPSEEIRSQLKHNAFRWSRYNGCWQSYLNRWQINRAQNILNPKAE